MFDRIFEKIRFNKELKDSGKQLSISPPFPRLAKKFPGFEKGKYIILTANSGIGKTKFTKFFCITSIYNFIKKHPNTKVKIWYFALEETLEDFWLSFVTVLLYEKYGLEIGTSKLKSLGEFNLSNDELEKVKECKDIVNELSSFVEVIDFISNPTGIYKYVRNHFDDKEVGEYTYKNVTIEGKEEKIINGYVHKTDTHYFCIIDHITLLQNENLNGVKMNGWETLGHFSKEYVLKGFCKRFGITSIIVQQQAADKEKQEFHNGNSIEQKLEPSLDGLGINKNIQQEADLILGLFSPARYKLNNYRGYDITKFKDKYRALLFLKDRHYGLANNYVNMYFNGASDYFSELPTSDEMKENPNLYKKYVE